MEFNKENLEIELENATQDIDLDIGTSEIDIEVETETGVDIEELNDEFSIESPKVLINTDHNQMTNREMKNQHPILAIEGLEEELRNAGKVQDVLVNGESVLDKEGNANIEIPEETDPTVPKHVKKITEEDINKWNNPEIPDTSEFIKNTVDNLVNYYLKSETYSKEEIDELANSLINLGYATEKWVKDQNYMPIEDFHEYINFLYYTKNVIDEMFENHYNKEEIDDKFNNLPSGGTDYKADDNIIIEDETIKGYTNTGDKVSDKDIKLQSITESGTSGTNKMVYIDGKEIEFLYDGTIKLRRAENGIDFDKIITLPCVCTHLLYNDDSKRLYGSSSSNYFIYSDDYGLTWDRISNSKAGGVTQLAIGYGAGFRSCHRSTKEIITWTFNETNKTLSQNTRIASTIIPEFTAMVNDTQYIWCNSTGTFKYGAGSQESNFASLSGITVNLLKRVNNITILGLKNNNKIYLLEPASMITQYKWVEHTLPDVCTVNDIIFNPYDETYYIFTDKNTYYKTKDLTNPDSFESIDKDGLRGIQGYFTLMGIQMTTSNHNELLLAPTRTKLENKIQELKRLTKKELLVGKGLELKDGRFNVKSNSDKIGVTDNGLYLGLLDQNNLSEDVIETLYVAKAQTIRKSPFEIEEWYWGEGYPENDLYACIKFRFTESGSFLNMVTWEDEIVVEEGEVGYLFYDQNMMIFKYVKLYNIRDLL